MGIIGATGSGKSTIVNLLIRFYDPDKGTVLVDGRDVRCIPREELCKKFGIAFQNDFIMANSIFENISFGRDFKAEISFRYSPSSSVPSFLPAYRANRYSAVSWVV